MATKVFIDGEHGTTGLQIRTRLGKRRDIDLISIAHADRHNADLRIDYLKSADIAILCLPDDAARDTVAALSGTSTTRIIDASTAHRIDPQWTYGFAEMTKGQNERINSARLVANPGCYPTGAISLIRPLRESGLLAAEHPTTINAVSGYSGGGKQMIAQMKDHTRDDAITANYFLYGLNLSHKHMPEIRMHGLLDHAPIFMPSVGRFPQGMIVNLPIHLSQLKSGTTVENIYSVFMQHYAGQDVISVVSPEEIKSTTRLDAESLADSDRMKIYIFSNEKDGIVNLSAVLDNLGKGASGAAVQNLNLMIKA